MLEIGLKGESSIDVTEENTALAYGSGELPVYATPALVALMEQACFTSVVRALAPGQGTVGTRMEVRHLSPTPVGMRVHCESALIEIDRRKLVFEVKAYDDAGLIGEGVHERFIIENAPFLEKANAKAAK
ncbi:MAG: thioesterase family protein [Christensenellales bacterium]|jgi:fluoroacetyl-CoA thioesterase